MVRPICVSSLVILWFFTAGWLSSDSLGQEVAKKAHAVGFRLPQFKTVHFDDAQKATVHSTTLQKIGCEVSSEAHAGHTDVIYRAERWLLLEPDSKEQADQWEKWLTQSGFEILRGRPKDALPPATSQTTTDVTYKLSASRLRHFPKEDERREHENISKALGCVVTQIAHAGHMDVKIECPDWMKADFPNHDVAHVWEAWLKKAGFETVHKH